MSCHTRFTRRILTPFNFLLLGMDQIGLGKNRASGRDSRTFTTAITGNLRKFLSGCKIQSTSLLIEKAAGAGGTRGVCGAAEIVAVRIED